jgi:hypothetical protein
MNEQIEKIAVSLGCPQYNVIDVLIEMKDYPVALTKKSLVYQVSNAMNTLGLDPNTASINTVASRL